MLLVPNLLFGLTQCRINEIYIARFNTATGKSNLSLVIGNSNRPSGQQQMRLMTDKMDNDCDGGTSLPFSNEGLM